MTERPILFSAPMVAAIREGRKTQTRRVVKGVDECPHAYDEVRHVVGPNLLLAEGATVRCPYGVAGDRLWVRESGNISLDKRAWMYPDFGGALAPGVPASEKNWAREWKSAPSIHMPRWACRLVLEVTGVRAERLQAISKKDAIAEGFREEGIQIGPGRVNFADGPIGAFRALWKVLNAKRAPWDSNPWVWVVEFKEVK